MFHINIENIDNKLVSLSRNVNSFCMKLKTELSSDTANIIMQMFPEATAIDKACITLCNDAILAASAIEKITPAINSKAEQINALFNNLHAQILQLQHDTPKHNFGYYLRVVGIVMEDIARSL